MNNWAARIKTRMQELEMTQEMLASKMDVTRGAITHYLSGRRVPPLKQFHKLAIILKVDPAWLQFGTGKTKASDKKNDNQQTLSNAHKIPIFSWDQVSSFIKGKMTLNNAQEYVPHFYSDQQNWFALKIKGDSMTSPTNHSKNFFEGEIIIIDPEKNAEHGDYVIAQLQDSKEATFKQYVIDGGVSYLKPNNPQYPLLKMDNKSRILGIMKSKLSFK